MDISIVTCKPWCMAGEEEQGEGSVKATWKRRRSRARGHGPIQESWELILAILFLAHPLLPTMLLHLCQERAGDAQDESKATHSRPQPSEKEE